MTRTIHCLEIVKDNVLISYLDDLKSFIRI